MNKRTLSIVRDLAQGRDELTIQRLADRMEVSTRTIRNDVTAINKVLAQHDMGEVTYAHGGVLVRPEGFADILDYLDQGDFYQYHLSKDERKQIASALLVNSPQHITLAQIADTLYVSRSTIIHDLDSIKDHVSSLGLEVNSHPNKGLIVTGDEKTKRVALMGIASSLASGGAPTEAMGFILVNEDSRATISKIVREQERMHERHLTDESFEEVMRYLGILVNRNLMGQYVEQEGEEDAAFYLLANDILKYISQYLGITTTEGEIRLLSRVLANQRYMRAPGIERDSVRIQVLTRHFIEQVSAELGVDLNDDYAFFEALSDHLITFFSTSRPHLTMLPVISKVMEANPNVVDIVREQIAPISAAMGRELEEPEMGYVVVHVCAALERHKNNELAFRVVVACHAGVGTSHLLVERLRKHFNFQIVDVVSAHEVEDIDPAEADLVISTVPLKACPLECVVVSPLLSDEDYLHVGEKVDSLRADRDLPSRVGERKITPAGIMELIVPVVQRIAPEKEQELIRGIRKALRTYLQQSIERDSDVFAPSLHHLIRPEHIRLGESCATWQDAVRASAQPLLEAGYIEERYVDAMLANIEENGPYVVVSPGFAVPHEGPEQGTIKMGMSLIRLAQPVEFGADEMDPVEFVCCLSATDHKLHLKAFFSLVNLLRQPSFKDDLRACFTPEEVIAVIERAEQTHE